MKKSMLVILVVMLLSTLLIPFNVKAEDKEYKTLNFKEALKEEEIEEKFSNYEETDDQITIYLFRGKGCGYCRAFLEFMNSITDEYGKYFKIVSYEVWYNTDNAELMEKTAKFLNKEASGVPFVIIGDKVFSGYTESYNDSIKSEIKKLYNSKDRYDVFEEMEKEGDTSKESNTSSITVILYNLAFVVISTIAIIVFNNYKFNKLSEQIESINNKKNK